jgi:protein TonB
VTDPWDDDESGIRARQRKRHPWIARIALGVGLCCFVGMLAWGALSLLSDGKHAKRQVVQISLLKLPPPPPPPPPPP